MFMNYIYITLFSFRRKSMSGGGTQHSLCWKTGDNSMFLLCPPIRRVGQIHISYHRDRGGCFTSTCTACQYLNGHHILLDQFVEASILMTLCTVHLHHLHLQPSSSKIIYWHCLSNQRFSPPSLLCCIGTVVVSLSGLYMVTNDHGKVRANTKINPDNNMFMLMHAPCLLVLFDDRLQSDETHLLPLSRSLPWYWCIFLKQCCCSSQSL